jgi:alkaline phosphatase D
MPSPLRLSLVLILLAAHALAGDTAPSRIAFGSCANENRAQPIWDTINKLDPQLFILTGDNVYADSADPAILRASYDKFGAIPGFAKLRASCPLLAPWDDHDYGANDAGVEWEGKGAAKEAFMAFYGTPPESPMRDRGGVYDAHVFGPEGKRLQVILLDTRWFRGPLKKLSKEEAKVREEKTGVRGPYLPDPESDSSMLGDEQWKWLEEQLKVPAEVRLIVSSVQAIADHHGFEKWGNLPRERQRLLKLIRDNAKGVIVLSGDRHTADISKLPPNSEDGPPYPLFDLTASALNQGGSSREENRYRVGTADPFGQPNFGWITIDWEQKDPAISLEIRDADGQVVREARTTVGELSR